MAAKKPKMTQKDDVAAVTTCTYWVPRKKRHCKMAANKESLFCGAHSPATEESKAVGAAAERIPCPLDPKHTVFKRKLAKHLTICNARDQASTLPYIVKNINAGEELENPLEDEINSKLRLHELEDTEFYSVIDKVRALYDNHVANSIEELHLQHASLEEPLGHEEYGQESRKHLVQASALLGILEHDQQLTDSTSFIEFGAGKGQLAFFLATALETQGLSHSQVVLIDRMSLRHKKDNKVTNKELVQRIRADIGDLKISALPELKQTKRNVALSKHLCGAATDLTLRCVLAHRTAPTDYILIALCCHHRCSWRSYVGQTWLQAAGLGHREFAIITKMVSWAVCGTGVSRERRKAMAEAHEELGEPPTQRLTREQREQIGYQCKRVLDQGRLEHLRSNGFDASLKFYVPREITLENVVLIAKPMKS
ncbi:tRNA:m(4)X modification enzyme TRM13 homolog [Drosophila pseudoobscura]|uniref:tRNA:m(4)X modification enzyme TRM13 n=1 Tax=Drosophila pseudoobscura pseudoobscura TaxID=46245 RepID=A0A6I8UPP9_DROPS|nr:tRNA:m(4)X modification enzyme TRM13 homolog [Drosophila pseudoobscura]